MPFGKYKGKHLAEIYYVDPSYMLWLANKFEPTNPRYERVVELAKRFAVVHFELTVRKPRIASVSHFVGAVGETLKDLQVTVLNVRLQVDTYKPDFLSIRMSWWPTVTVIVLPSWSKLAPVV